MRIFSVLMLCLLCLCCCSYSQQNLHVDYNPLKSKGVLPEIFTKSVKEIVAEEISSLNNAQDSNNKIKSDIFTLSNYAINWKIKSGNTLLNEEITEYLNNMVDVILKDQPVLRKKIQTYPSKSPVVNAATYYNGTVFVDLGLLAHAKNEAQIAFILCHEISHYIKQHTVQKFIHYEKLESSAEGKSHEDIFKEKCHYSKENESEADTCGFNLLKATDYDVTQTLELFDILQYSHLPFELLEFDKSFFETDNFIIPSKYNLSKLKPITDNSNEDDSLHTHPNTSKRKEAISKLMDQNSTGDKFILGESRFNYVRDLARFETTRLLLRYRDYNAALYSAYVLSKKYPDNLFLAQTISKCLYAISLNHTGYLRYNKDSYLDGPIHYLQVESYPQQLYYLINKMTDSEWNILSLNYAFRQHLKFPNDPLLSAISDSLFQTMSFVNAQFATSENDSVIVANVNPNPDTASWFKNVFKDLFLTNKEFATKFPQVVGKEFVVPYTPKSYHVNRFEKKMRVVENIGKVMCLNPMYLIFDEKEIQAYFNEAEIGQNRLLQSIINCSLKQNFELVILDPGLIDSLEVNKLNDYSVINDWLIECSDGEDNEKSKVPVFSTDELQDVVSRYGTSHLLRTGFAVLSGKSTKYVFFSVVYDLRLNKLVYIKQELFKGKPSESDMQDKICSLFHELKFGK